MDWIRDGLCRDKDPKYWFPSGDPIQARKDQREGQLICNRCPVQQECRDYALKNEAYGTWGGLDEVSRELYRARHDMPLLMTLKDRKKIQRLKHLV